MTEENKCEENVGNRHEERLENPGAIRVAGAISPRVIYARKITGVSPNDCCLKVEVIVVEDIFCETISFVDSDACMKAFNALADAIDKRGNCEIIVIAEAGNGKKSA